MRQCSNIVTLTNLLIQKLGTANQKSDILGCDVMNKRKLIHPFPLEFFREEQPNQLCFAPAVALWQKMVATPQSMMVVLVVKGPSCLL
ncbi:hypothetical protein U9M48_037510 [Paspalum notatum var. saurae]|uniref:Uncharacterized protein n=1 Tax=Paspalum notatum var. saurae TaxID=547442 RepID=A0AAQ3UJW0_PASNO